MTTLDFETSRCAICDTANNITVIGSTNYSGSPDLDTRPPQMARSNIFTWVHRCPDCGYCASDLSESHPSAKDVINKTEYQEQLNDPTCSELANSFLCKAMIDREAEDYASATWALIHAAWVCDDDNHDDEAKKCRHKAADMLMIAEDHGQQVAEQEGASTALLVDLLRRAGRMDDAQRVILERSAGIAEDVINRILIFQSVLIERNDTSCHRISEAFGEE